MLVATALPALWTRRGARLLMAGWLAAFALFFALMLGGFAGLAKVETDRWGGLPLTVILTLIGMTASAPLGILLALGRRSTMPLPRLLAIGYIELVRGVPLITVLFVATFIFPLLLPAGFRLDPFWRIVIGIVLFQAAYMAETVRGGLQTIPRGQFDAAASLGLSYWRTQRHVVLPQALVAVIPAFVNSLLSTFMDTSLVTVVSMYDLTGSLRLALGDPQVARVLHRGLPVPCRHLLRRQLRDVALLDLARRQAQGRHCAVNARRARTGIIRVRCGQSGVTVPFQCPLVYGAAAGEIESVTRRRFPMKKTLLPAALLAALSLPVAAQQAQQVNVICSVQADWCNMIQTVFAKTTGIKVNMSLKGSGEALAQLIAERANPKTDVWFGGTGDPHLQAAEQDLTTRIQVGEPAATARLGAAAGAAVAATRRWASTAGRSASATTPSCWRRRR